MRAIARLALVQWLCLCSLVFCRASDALELPRPESPEVILGDRLFFETRFAQFFAARCHGQYNARLAAGDPVVATVTVGPNATLPNPFRAQSMSCRQCHLGDDFAITKPLAQRTYDDFTPRSAIPHRDDGLVQTERNSPPMVDLALPRSAPLMLHFDGEFASFEDLAFETLIGRNFGWLPSERTAAIAHVAAVIRNDAGMNPRGVRDRQGRAVPYVEAMSGAASLPPRDRAIPAEYRVDFASASDVQIVRAVASLLRAYMQSLRFAVTSTPNESISPYDLFLQKNGLSHEPREGESVHDYARRLLTLLHERDHFEWVTDVDGQFHLHDQQYRFGPAELRGMMIFLTQRRGRVGASLGNCVACHPPPQFTDHDLHNTGVAQANYDAVFGRGAFARLEVPGLVARNAQFDFYMPRTFAHPNARNRFRSSPSADRPGFADLGVWNVFANPDFPGPQRALLELLCERGSAAHGSCTPQEVLPRTIALFKTPSLRDPGHSNPYFHAGTHKTIEDVLEFYLSTARLARSAGVRNGASELAQIFIESTDVVPLAAFLRSLNEDYQ